jgi:outer membrane protein OmpA-like peptidoglycan-associated protein
VKRSLVPLAALAAFATACAATPRPASLIDADNVSKGAAAAEARTFAPGAFTHAEELRREAARAEDTKDLAGAQILAERALAAYAHASTLARIARAEGANDEAQKTLAATKRELAELDGEQVRLAAEADALELKVRVAREAQPVQPSGKADPVREQARLATARALALQARLLCAGARMLTGGASNGAAAAQLEEASTALVKLEADLGAATGPAPGNAPSATPIDAASRARAGCLAALTQIRRAATPVSRAPGVGDALLTEISAMGSYAPARDDRGISVTLRGVFAGAPAKDGSATLSPDGAAHLATLAKVAAAHPTFPIEVVIHRDRPLAHQEEPAERARAEAVARALGAPSVGVKIEPIVAGNAAPIVDPAGADRSRNTRVEIVFVTPEFL